MKQILLVILITAVGCQRDISKYHTKPICYQLQYAYHNGAEAIDVNIVNVNVTLVQQDSLYRLVGMDKNNSFSLQWIADSFPIGSHVCSITNDTTEHYYALPVYQGNVLLTEGPYYAPVSIGVFAYTYSFMTVRYELNADSLKGYFAGYLYNPAVLDSAFLTGSFMLHTGPRFIRPR